jgi:bifunctional non-homologous end joining protein LigD
LSIPHFTPADLVGVPDAFDRDDFIFELKMDGFRALAYIDEHETQLVSRKGNVYRSFARLSAAIQIDMDCRAVMDGEIVCLDKEGRPQFEIAPVAQTTSQAAGNLLTFVGTQTCAHRVTDRRVIVRIVRT